jgi:fermentation-respiration switch protein FrsA (DUF1100 family)
MRPTRIAVGHPSADLAPTTENVALRSADGVLLQGWYVPSTNRAAVLLGHGWGANRTQLLPEARALVNAGYGVLLLDQRAHGESGGEITTFGDRERMDVRAAVDWLVTRPDVDPSRIGALGFSSGGPGIALQAAGDTRIRTVVLEAVTTSLVDAARDESGPYSWLVTGPALLVLWACGVDVASVRTDAAVVRLAPRPLLIVHGDQDRIVPLSRAEQLYRAAHEPKRLLIVKGAGHGDFGSVDPRYEEALVRHFDDAMAASPASTRPGPGGP